MSKQAPFSLRIFVADGDPDGLRLVERSNWIGKGVLFPRAIYPDVRNRFEFQQTGVYLLLGPSPLGDGEMLYVGEGDPVRPRFEGHYAKKDFWTRAVFFVASQEQLNKAHVQYLEAQLYARASAAKRVALDNGNKPAEPTLSEADRADMDVFLHNILGMLPVLGIPAFEQSPVTAGNVGMTALTCQGRGATARGQDTPQGFVVRSGSHAVVEEVPSLREHFPNVTKLRSSLVADGVLLLDGNLYRFAQDFAFNSPSLAGAVVMGRSANGRLDWKDASGRTFRQIQEAQAEN